MTTNSELLKIAAARIAKSAMLDPMTMMMLSGGGGGGSGMMMAMMLPQLLESVPKILEAFKGRSSTTPSGVQLPSDMQAGEAMTPVSRAQMAREGLGWYANRYRQ